MENNLGWFEFIADDRVPKGVGIGIFSIKWRIEDDPDCYYPDIILRLDQEKFEGIWYIAEMSISNPEISEFAELAIRVLRELQDQDFTTIKDITKHLSTFLKDKIPDHI